jgi:hypothetical protein
MERNQQQADHPKYPSSFVVPEEAIPLSQVHDASKITTSIEHHVSSTIYTAIKYFL